MNNGSNDSRVESQDQGKQDNLPLQNPLQPDSDKKITQEDIENEQKYKEALTERD